MLNLISAAALNAISLPIDCLVASLSINARAIWRHLFSSLVPATVIAIISLYWGYHSLVKRRAERWYFWRRVLLTTITVAYVTYFDTTLVAVKVFNCISVFDSINPFSSSFTRYWIGDMSIECYKSTHVVLIGISLVILIIVSIGFPIACSIALLRNKNEVNISSSRAHEILGLLCGPFKERFIYWECITMIKKAILSIIIVFSYSLGNQAQGLLISIVLVFFLTLHSTCYPFKKEFNTLNYYEIGSLMTSCITYTLVQLFSVEKLSETERSLLSISVIVLNGGFVISMLVNITRHLITFAKVTLRSYQISDIHDEIGLFETIRIYCYSWWSGKLSSERN